MPVYFYEKFLKVGVKFPLHPFICSVLGFFKIAPRWLMPNLWRFLLVLLILSRIFKPPFLLDLVVFLHFYYLKDASDLSHFSFYYKGKFSFLVISVPSNGKV